MLRLNRFAVSEPRVMPCAEDAQRRQLEMPKDLEMISPFENGNLKQLTVTLHPHPSHHREDPEQNE